MQRVIIDTNILIDHSKGKSNKLKELFELKKLRKAELYLTPVVIAEFLADDKLISAKNKQKAISFINLFDIVNITKKIGLKAGDLLRNGNVNHIADALIASSCIEGRLGLVTRNEKHFNRVKGISFF